MQVLAKVEKYKPDAQASEFKYKPAAQASEFKYKPAAQASVFDASGLSGQTPGPSNKGTDTNPPTIENNTDVRRGRSQSLFRLPSTALSFLHSLARATGCYLALVAFSAAVAAEPAQSTLVGQSVRFEQVVIDGPKQQAKPITKETPLVLRIERVYPHGSAFRYDIEAYALEVGDYDLRDYLEPADGATATDVGETNGGENLLTLRVGTSIDEKYVTPNALKSGRAPWLGGYRLFLALAGIAWLLGLIGLLRWGRKQRAEDKIASVASVATTADRLRPLVQDAVDGKLDADKKAVLERLLLTHWRERLDLTNADPAEGLATLREHPEAGELLRNLEDWLHRPDPPTQVDVEALLRPYLKVTDASIDDAIAGKATG